jgi:hypothetical protein
MGYAGKGIRVAAIGILLVIGILAPAAGARPLLKGTKGADRLSGGKVAETLKGGKGNDRMSGGGGNDLLFGGPGNDTLSGDGGLDDLRGEAGNDLLKARDDKADRVNCGSGRDKAIVDAIDGNPPAGPSGSPAPGGNPVDQPGPGSVYDATHDSTLIAAGDIAGHETDVNNDPLPNCSTTPEQTAKLVDKLAGPIAILGDAVYEVGSVDEYQDCYEKSWGRHKWRTRPAVGDHDYKTPGAAGFFSYFGAAGGALSNGWYSYDIGSWHAVVLNTKCDVVACTAGSAQEQWLRADLAAHPATCTLAYWHTPYYSSGSHGNTPAVAALFKALYDYGVELVLSGNDHDYERFAPQNMTGDLDLTRGVRQFVVGTGGRYLRPLDATKQPNSEASNDTTFGVLNLKLNGGGYDWHFMPVPGSSFTDSGSGTCH